MGILSIAGAIVGCSGMIGLLVAGAPILSFLTGIVGEKAAKPVFYIIGALLIGIGLWSAWSIWLHHHDKGVIAGHEAVIANQVSAETNTGTAKADAIDNVIATQDAARSAAVNVSIANAVAAHPVEAHHAAGPASQAALNSLRKRNGR